MRYATIVPQYAIDKLLTIYLDVNSLWMQTKCDVSLDFFISNANAPWRRCKCNFFIYDANVPCRDENAKFIHDDASARI